jgi:hypothetical protein
LIADAIGGQAESADGVAGEILDLAALDAASFVSPVETFDLRELVARTLSPFSAAAISFRWRIDPLLPTRLRGRARAFARMLAAIAGHVLDGAEAEAQRVRIDFAAVSGGGRRIRLRLRVDTFAGGRPDAAVAMATSLRLRLAQGLIGLMKGEFAMQPIDGRSARLIVLLPFAVEETSAEPVLDLGGRSVLVATEDAGLADQLIQVLTAWNAAAGWLGDVDGAIGELPGIEPLPRPIIIADARSRLLPALSLAHHAAALGAEAPLLLLIAENEQIERVAELEGGEIDGFIPAPLTARLLANALSALPLGAAAPPLTDDASPDNADPPVSADDPAWPDTGRITPITAHPKFIAEPSSAVDPGAVERLHALGGGPEFFGEVVETFRTDARRIMGRLRQAVGVADPAGFGNALVTLIRAAGPLGGAPLCELAMSLDGVTESELRHQGPAHIQRLDAEIERLAGALTAFLPAGAARQT